LEDSYKTDRPPRKNGQSAASVVEEFDRELDGVAGFDAHQLANAIEALPASFVLFDGEGNFVHCNQTHKDFYPHVADLYQPGTNRNDILERHARKLGEQNPDLDIDKYIADRLDQVLSARPDAETQLSDGRWIQIRERVISGGGLVSIRTDISERKKAEADLRDARVELERNLSELKASKAILERQTAELERLAEEQAALNAKLEHEVAIKNLFFSIVSHDLRSPFTPILGMSRLMAESVDGFSKEKISLYAKGIFSASEQYFDVLEKLLQWSRVQMAADELKPETISVQDLALDALELLKPIALEKAIQVTLHDTTNTAFADFGMTRSVLQNLITNALKFTPAGGAVEISSRDQGAMVQVTVTDTGVGVPSESVQTLFTLEKKTTTRGTGGEAGSGLGLPLCKQLVEKNGGNIWFESDPGSGSRFHFTLPTEPPSTPSPA
jgi:signal transduction histidine kinase